jgi:hypothetical protein
LYELARLVDQRRTCSVTCEQTARDAQDKAAFLGSGARALRELRAAGIDPARSGEALARLRASQAARQAEENAWNEAHPVRPRPEEFRDEVLPLLQDVSASRLARETGLSLGYCARIKRGEEVPHSRWWEALRALGPAHGPK